MRGIQRFLSDILISMISDDNILTMYRLAEQLLCHHVLKRVEDFILTRIQDLSQHPKFLPNCSRNWLEKWLKADELNADEETVFHILLAWSNLSSENSTAFQSLVRNVRFQLLKTEFFTGIVQPNLDPSLTAELHMSLNLSSSGGFRLPYELVFAVGGFEKSPLGTVEVFDPRSEKWLPVDKSFPAHAYHGLVISPNHELVVFGGFGQEGHGSLSFSSSTYFFDLHSKVWTRRASMIGGPRCYVSTAELNGDIFLMGGSNGEDRLRTVEKYSFRYNEFQSCHQMQQVHRVSWLAFS
jgi:kelch-like protein 10